MDEVRAREVLDAVGRAVPGAVLLWRGAGLDGSDVDVVVVSGRDAAVSRALRDAGLTAAPQDPGHILWRLLPGEIVVVDVLADHGWPRMYPALEGVMSRSTQLPDGLLLAAPPDRLLIHAAEAVAGWPIEKVLRKVRPVLDEAGAQASLQALASRERVTHLASLVEDPDRLSRQAHGGRLPVRPAIAAGVRSPTGRMALRARASARLGLPERPPLPRVAGEQGQRPSGLVVALSGMDGAGKSTTALELAAVFEEQHRPAVILWTRLAGDPHLLNLVARPVRWLLGRGTDATRPRATPPRQAVAGVEATSGGQIVSRASRGRLIDAVWVTFVALETVRGSWRAFGLRRRGLSVICDRWAADALVDLRLRYGRHRVAEWLLTHAIPPPDLVLYLKVDAATAAARKPGDQPLEVLEAMAELYGRAVADPNVVRIDAGAERAVVIQRAAEALRASLASTGWQQR